MSVSSPERKKKFCSECGVATVTACLSCDAPVKGEYLSSLSVAPYSLPSFCDNCGGPYPWTEASLKAAKDLSDEIDALTTEEKELLKRSLEDIVRDTPRTAVASARFKRLAAKGGKEAAEGFKQILIGIATETAKKMIWQ
jgi:hypothetical protein